ncbi:MAG: hypothetical protein AVDCRST_MAG53-1221 [uncultured Solirubrobacteraceae bacterium]|uniref:Uncharacterized protein n=1 Tax=uncultured Solirubrobacteraceae bacterium TaxID=1162706 RepID=A0A6J4RI21_9ACTN|nr:MAG: hypothetical protein AVDCRST_MAG53-1221 [uncultured Solirubrobacteraceae bacterium]
MSSGAVASTPTTVLPPRELTIRPAGAPWWARRGAGAPGGRAATRMLSTNRMRTWGSLLRRWERWRGSGGVRWRRASPADGADRKTASRSRLLSEPLS